MKPKHVQEIRDIHNPFLNWLRERGIPYVHTNPTVRSTIAKGHPDFLVSYQGRCIYIECKRPDKGRLSDAQIEYIEFLRRAGNTVVVAKSFADCVEAVEAWLAGKPIVQPEPAKPAPDDAPYRLMTWRQITYVVKVEADGSVKRIKEASIHDLRTYRRL